MTIQTSAYYGLYAFLTQGRLPCSGGDSVPGDGALMYLQGGGEPSLVTFTTPNTYEVGASTGQLISSDGSLWVLEDAAVCTMKYIGTSKKLYLVDVKIALVGLNTTVAQMSAAGIDLNGDLLTHNTEDEQALNFGCMPVSVPTDEPFWLHAVRYVEVEENDELSLVMATSDGSTRTASAATMSLIEITDILT